MIQLLHARGAADCAALLACAALAACGGSDDDPKPTRVVFFLGDGTGIATQTAARIYEVREDGDLTMDTLPETAFVPTCSANAQVTDSAPSMAADMTGVKLNNEVISMAAETQAFDSAGNDYLNGTDGTCPASGKRSTVQATVEPMPAELPWTQPNGCMQKDYSDLLD